jgi:GT2 family glycosyltransferase
MAEPWVRIIVVNYNCGKILQDCVDAIALQSLSEYEVIVVDNGSTDDSILNLKLPDGRFRIQRLGTNSGFAAANNAGARDCSAPWIATLNPDAFPARTWLEELQAATKRYPWADAFGSTQLQSEHRDMVDGFGDVFCIWGFAWRGCGGQPVTTLPNGDREVFAPCAAAALYSQSAFNAVGGFDESFFCYLEDVDLGFRLRLNGLRCIQVRRAEVLHMGSATTGVLSDFTIFHSYRNRVWLLIKNMPSSLLVLMLCVHVPLVLLNIARAKGFSRKAALKGLWTGIIGLGPVLKGRACIQSQRMIDSRTLARMMVWDFRKLLARAPHFLSGDQAPALAMR